MTGGQRDTFTRSDDPPFLQEPTVPVPPPGSNPWRDRLTDFLDSTRPPVMLLMIGGLIGVGLLLYATNRSGEPAADPLEGLAAPTTSPATVPQPTGPSSTFDRTPATVGPDIGLSRSTDAPTTAATSPPTTAAPTTPTTEQATTTTQPPTTTTTEPTTTEAPTTQPPPSSTVIELDDCIVTIRSTDVFAGPSEDSEKLGKARRGRYEAVAFSANGDGWVQIEWQRGLGWIEARRVVRIQGDCD